MDTRVVVFSRGRTRGKYGGYPVHVRFYLHAPVKGVKPYFEARVDRDIVVAALERFGVNYEDRGDHLILYGGDLSEKFMMLVVLCGAIHGVSSAQGWRVLDIVSRMNPFELIFWYSRFVEAYDMEGLKGVSRIARSMRILYRL